MLVVTLFLLLAICFVLNNGATPFPVPPSVTSGNIQRISTSNGDGFKAFRTWCSQPGAGCLSFNLLSYDISTAADLNNGQTDSFLGDPTAFASKLPSQSNYQGSYMLYQLQNLADLFPNYGKAQRTYRISFQFRQHKSNSVENDPNRLPLTTIQVYLVQNLDISVTNVMAPDFNAAQLIPAGTIRFTSQTTSWTSYSSSFSLKSACYNCKLVMRVEYDSWTSWWGTQFYLANVTLQELPTTLELPPLVHVSQHRIVKIPVMPQVTAVTASSCPHAQSGLSSWSNSSIWPGGVIPTFGSDVTLPTGASVLLKGSDLSPSGPFSYYTPDAAKDSKVMPSPTAVHGHFSSITIPKGSKLIIDDSPLILGIHRLVVYGQLILGAETCRLTSKIQFIFDGNDQGGLPVQESKGLLAFGEGGASGSTPNGRLEMHGKEVYPWIRLSRTAFPSDTILYLQEEATNWEIGQTIVISTTIWRTLDRDENEVRIIKNISPSKKEIEIDSPLLYVHYAGKEFQGEVSLLSRSIELYGSRSYQSTDKWGGHVMIARGGLGKIAGTAAVRMGQTNELARYPFHFHMLESSPESAITDSVIVESFYRCVVVHGTDNSTVSRNVAFRVRGHCYYIEDGVEENNTFAYNLGLQIMTINASAAGWGQSGEVFIENDYLRNPADTSAGSFYITNAHNSFIGNVAVGGWTGFAFPNLPRPINLHRNLDYSSTLRNPENRNLIIFDGNTARSTASIWYESGGIYVGGLLFHLEDGRLFYRSGRQARNTYDNQGQTVWMQMTNTLTAHTFRGIAHWGNQIEVRHFENHESVRGLVLFGDVLTYDALINARTENSRLVDLQMPSREGFQYYDTWVKTLLVQVTFTNYNHSLGDSVILGMTHSDTWKPQGINAARAIKFENCTRKARFQINNVPTGSSWMYNLIDYDGSTVNANVPMIVGSHQPWWNYDNQCQKDIDWDLWICPKKSYSIASLEIIMPNITRSDAETNQPESHRHIGYMSLLSRGPKQTRLPLTKNPTTTGISNSIWYMELFGGSPRHIEIDTIQIPMNHFLVLAIPYTSRTTSFSVMAYQKYYWGRDGPKSLYIPQATSFQDLFAPEQLKPKSEYICPDAWNPPSTSFNDNVCATGGIGPLWYFNGSMLFIRMVDLVNYVPALVRSPDFKYAREGAELNTIENMFRWFIDVNCPDQCDDNPKAQTCFFPSVVGLEETTIDIPKPSYRCSLKTVPTPTASPSMSPTVVRTAVPSRRPTVSPTRTPTRGPSLSPSSAPNSNTRAPSVAPTRSPVSSAPTTAGTNRPTPRPTPSPTVTPTRKPTRRPSPVPTATATRTPTRSPSLLPTVTPGRAPSLSPSRRPTIAPTATPTTRPATKSPTRRPTRSPTKKLKALSSSSLRGANQSI